MAPKNPSKIWRQIFLANANLNGLAIDNNQSRTSSEHFDPPLFQNPHKIILNIVQDFNNRDIIEYLRIKSHQPAMGYTDLSTDSLKKCLEFEGGEFCV